MFKKLFLICLGIVCANTAGFALASSDQVTDSSSTRPTVDVATQNDLKAHFQEGMKYFHVDDFDLAVPELLASTSVKEKYDWQTWYVTAYTTLGAIFQFHSKDPDHKALAYLYYSLALEKDPDAEGANHNIKSVASAKSRAEFLMAKTSIDSDIVQESPQLETVESKPDWISPPQPKMDSRNLYFDIYSTYKNDAAGSNLFSIADLYASRKLDENSTTADLQIRFSKNLSTNDSANEVDLRIAKISYMEPWLQVSVGRMDIFPLLTPMTFFGAYTDMGIHRADGAMAVIPISFDFGDKNDSSYSSLPTALTVFYTPSLLEASDVVLDTQQAYLLTQARAKVDFAGIESLWSVNFAWTSTDYFTYSSLNGGSAFSATGDIHFDKEFSLYGEFGDQNTNLFNSTDVVGLGAKVQKIGTWGPLSLDLLDFEVQLPIENDPNNVFAGANPFNPSLAASPVVSWYGELKTRLKLVTVAFAITNNLDDFTLNRLNSQNSSFAANFPVGPGRELEKSQIPLLAVSSTQPAFLVSLSADF
jgi:hypothetical protein